MHDIQIILVLYKQNLAESKSFISIKSFSDKLEEELHLFVYDNSPTPQKGHLDSINTPNLTLEYFHDIHNSGVSKAYNMGAQYAKNNSRKWLLLLDQDSIFDQSLFREFVANKKLHNDIYLFVPLLKSGEHYISPCKYYLNKGFATKKKITGKTRNKFKSILNSGIFIEITTFFKLGGYDENVPLYFSDFVFFNRYRKQFDSFVVLDSTINHDLSDMSTHTLSNSIRTFTLFCEGAKQASGNLWDFCKYWIVVSGRALILSIRYRNPIFFIKLIRIFCGRKNNFAS